MSMARSRMWLASIGLMLIGCPKSPATDGGDDPPLCEDDFRESYDRLQLSANRDVDILFVIDNSASMAAAQARLATGVEALIEVLERPDVDANYRIAVTTTDNGNPWCPPAETTPEAGNLVLSSCKSRLDEFVSAEGVDAQDLACNDLCSLDEAQLAITPTATSVDPTASPRLWIERDEGLTNLPPGTEPAQALRCLLPQGIDGCGFESPLESMYLALTRAMTVEEASYGFVRADAVLVVVFLTDEVDCSHDKDWAEIFAADGNKAFWSDPDASSPSSAVCWNAGVACSGDPSGYDSCDPVDKRVDGSEAIAEADAVLHPMSRYRSLLDYLEQDKQQLNAGQELIVALIGGVIGSGENWSVSYVDVSQSDPEFHLEYGIGPGCTAADGSTALPPVRLRELGESFDAGYMYSICEADYRPAFEAIGASIREQMPRSCYTKCVADLDPSTAVVEPSCIVEQNPPGQGSEDVEMVQQCARELDGRYRIDPETGKYAMPSADANVCYALRVDPDGTVTPDPADDISPDCAEYNYNLEFVIERRPGFPAPDGTAVYPECELADCPADHCPGIGG